MFVDSHCHLSFPELARDWPAIRIAMQQAQVERALNICTTMEEFAQVHRLALTHDNIWATVGVHPDNEGVHEPDVAELLACAQLPRVLAIGETGLDYYRLNGRSVADMQWQRERFQVHMEAAAQSNKPLVIHTRNASADTVGMLQAQQRGPQPITGVFHCFTETREVARAALDMGFYISFSGILTFKNAQDLRDVAAFVPMDRLLIETDSPYLAPAPHRGKTNNPSLLPLIAQQLATLKQCSVQEMGQVCSHNFDQLFHPEVH